MSVTIVSTPSLARLPQLDASSSAAATSAAGHLHEIASTTSVEQVHAANLADMKDVMREVFASHRRGIIGWHEAQIDSLIDSRAAKLLEIKESPADVRAMLSKAAILDRVSTTASDFVRAMPFQAASVLQYMKPQINEGKWLPIALQPLAPFISGAVSGVMDTVGTGMMNQMTGNAHYLRASPDQLHDAMVHSLENNDPGKKQKVLDHAIGIQGYSVRNAARTGVGPAMEHFAPSAKGATDISFVVGGGLLANVFYGNRIHTTEQRDSLRGGAFLFGRKDAQPKENMDDETEWLDAYMALKDAGVSSLAFNAVKRVAGLPVDGLTDGLSALRNLATPTTVLQNGFALSAGFAAVGMAQGALAGHVSQPVAKEAVRQITNTVMSAGIFAGWTALGVVIAPVADKAVEFLKNDVKGAPAVVAKTGIKVGQAGIDAGMAMGKVGVEVGQAGIDASIAMGRVGVKESIEVGRRGIKASVRLGAKGAEYARVTGAELNRRYEQTLRSRQPRQPDVEAAGGGLDGASNEA